jgi:stage II sporulation protein GA (sporulation sigma-E factor processing peptidase)
LIQTATWEKIWKKHHFITHHLLLFDNQKVWTAESKKFHKKMEYPVLIRVGCKTVETKGFYDTGNCLYEPVTHQPVSVIERKAVSLLIDDVACQTRLRMIPYRTIGLNNGIMRGFIADEIRIYTGFDSTCYERPVLAVAEQSFSHEGGYQIILHPDLIK